MAAKKKEAQNTEKTSPVKDRYFITLIELKTIFERLRKRHNEVSYLLDPDDKTTSARALEYLGNIKMRYSSLYKDDYRIMGSERDSIIQEIYDIAQIVFKENKPRIDSYFEFYLSATQGEQRVIRSLLDAEWSFDHIMDYIEKERADKKDEAKVDLYTPDENRLIVRLTDDGWPSFRIKEFINKIRAGEILGMTASKLLEEMDKNIKLKPHHNDSVDALVYGLQEHYKKSEKKDMVNHPPHYNVGGFEVIDIIKTFTEGLEGIEAVDTANAIKYILRWHRKNGVEDLKKAKWYIEHLIKEVEDGT